MGVPYENATSGLKARAEAQKILQSFGCETIGFMDDFQAHEIILQFTHQGRGVQFKASAEGWAKLFLKENPYGHRMKRTQLEYKEKALNQGMLAVNSILRDWVKGQVTAVETGVLSFEHVFMPFMLIEGGKTIFDLVQSQNLLPSPD